MDHGTDYNTDHDPAVGKVRNSSEGNGKTVSSSLQSDAESVRASHATLPEARAHIILDGASRPVETNPAG